eukprot:2765253-Rhodomonas_salina.2
MDCKHPPSCFCLRNGSDGHLVKGHASHSRHGTSIAALLRRVEKGSIVRQAHLKRDSSRVRLVQRSACCSVVPFKPTVTAAGEAPAYIEACCDGITVVRNPTLDHIRAGDALVD